MPNHTTLQTGFDAFEATGDMQFLEAAMSRKWQSCFTFSAWGETNGRCEGPLDIYNFLLRKEFEGMRDNFSKRISALEERVCQLERERDESREQLSKIGRKAFWAAGHGRVES